MQFQNDPNFQGQQQNGLNAPIWGSSYSDEPYNAMGRMLMNMGPRVVQSKPAEVKDDKQGKSEQGVKK